MRTQPASLSFWSRSAGIRLPSSISRPRPATCGAGWGGSAKSSSEDAGTDAKADVRLVAWGSYDKGKPRVRLLLDALRRKGRLAGEIHIDIWQGIEDKAVAGKGVSIAVQAEQLGTGHAVAQAREALAGFSGDVLILYGDVPLVRAETMRAMVDRLHGPDAPACVVLGFRPADAAAYGRIIAGPDGRIDKMVEYKDASDTGRAVALCNSGLMAVRAADLFALLARVGNDNAAGEYYLPDIVMLAAKDGRASAVIETDAGEVAGVNSRAELASVEAAWQARRRAEAMRDGVTLVAPETVFFAHDTQIERDVTIEPNVVFGPGVTIAEGAVIHAFSHLEGAQVGRGVSGGPYARLRTGAVLGGKG